MKNKGAILFLGLALMCVVIYPAATVADDSVFVPGLWGWAERSDSALTDLDYSRDFSVELWTYVPSFVVQGRYAGYISKYQSGSSGWGIHCSHDYFNNYTKRVGFVVSDGSESVNYQFLHAGYAYLVMNWDVSEKKMTVYLNGEFQASKSNSNIQPALIESNDPLTVGYNLRSLDRGCINADIYMARIWNRSLDAGEISAIYQPLAARGLRTLPDSVSRTNLVSEWIMEESSDANGNAGTTHLKDTAGGNHLEIMDSAYFDKEKGALTPFFPSEGANNVGPSAYLEADGGEEAFTNPTYPLHYYFQVDESPDFDTSNLKESGWLASHSKWQPTLKPQTTYYWRVKCKDSAATPQTTEYTSTIAFTTRAPKNWFVRPYDSNLNYGSESGESYANAWNGLTQMNYSFPPSPDNNHGVKWGPGGVEAGDTLYVCDKHIHEQKSSLNKETAPISYVTVDGFSEEYPVTIRTDWPEAPGIIYNFSKPHDAPFNWVGPDSNGVYYTSSVIGNPPAYMTDAGDLQVLLRKESPSHFGNEGCWSDVDGKIYVKLPGGANPADRIYRYYEGYAIAPIHRKYITFKNCNFYGYHFEDERTDVGDYPRSTYITWDNCTIQLGAPLIEISKGNDYWRISNNTMKNASSAIYAWNNKEGRSGCNITIENNHISNLGSYEYYFYDGDNHGVGAQGASDWLVQGNRIENAGTGIEFWNGVGPERYMRNNVIRWNFIKDIKMMKVTTGCGIVISGDNGDTLGLRTGFEIHGNIIVNVEGHGISSNNPDPVLVTNNLIVNFGLGGTPPYDHDVDGHGISESVTDYPPAMTVKNNIIINSANRDDHDYNKQYFIRITGLGNDTSKLDIDYNCYYPNANTGYKFTGHRSFSQWQAAGFDAHGIMENPALFATNPTAIADPRDGMLHKDSPCIDSGTDVGINKDYLGTARPLGAGYDMGPFESVSQTDDTPPARPDNPQVIY